MTRFATRIFSVVLAGLLAFAGAAWADTIELKDGRLIDGKYMGGTTTNVRFQSAGRTRLYRVSDVVAVMFGDAALSTYEPVGTSYPYPSTYGSRATSTTTQRQTAATTVVPAQTRLKVRMIDGIDSETNKVGDEFRATLEEDLVVDGRVAAWKGSEVRGHLVEVEEAGRITGRSELTLKLTEIEVNGRLYQLTSGVGETQVEGKSRSKDSALKIGGGAAIGAVIGAIAGGGKGAAIGAIIGGGTGTAVQVLTKGQKVKVPSETVLEFVLQENVSLPANRTARPVR